MERDTLPSFSPRHARRPEPSLDDLRWEFHGWECWKGISGLYYARPHGAPRSAVQADDLADLRDEIIRWIWRNDSQDEDPGAGATAYLIARASRAELRRRGCRRRPHDRRRSRRSPQSVAGTSFSI